MKYGLLLCLILFCSWNAFAQDTSNDEDNLDIEIEFRDGVYSSDQVVDLVFSKKNNALARNLGIYIDQPDNTFRIAILGTDDEPISWRLFDMSGRFSQQGKQVLTEGENNFEISVGNLTKGIYVLVIQIQDELLNKKIMVW